MAVSTRLHCFKWVFFCLFILCKLLKSSEFFLSVSIIKDKALSSLPSALHYMTRCALWLRMAAFLPGSVRTPEMESWGGGKKIVKRIQWVVLGASERIKVEGLARKIISGAEGCIKHPSGLWKILCTTLHTEGFHYGPSKKLLPRKTEETIFPVELIVPSLSELDSESLLPE